MAQGWDRLHDESVYAQCLPDNNPYEGASSEASSNPPFPYDLQALRDQNGPAGRARLVETH